MKNCTADRDASGFILPDADKMPAGSRSLARWLWFFLEPYKKVIAAYTAFRLLRFTYLATLPLAIGKTIDAFETGWAFGHAREITILLSIYFAIYAFFLLTISIFYGESATEDRIIRGLTLFSVKHMNGLSLHWHETQGSGGKLQRIMTARGGLKQLYRLYKWYLVPFISALIGIVISIFMINAPFWFIFLYAGFVINFFAAAWILARRLPELHDKHNYALEGLLAGVYEFVSAIRTVKAFDMRGYIETRALHMEGRGHAAMRDVFRAVFTKWTVLNGVAVFWLGLFAILCLNGIFNGWISSGAFATCFFLAHSLWKILEELVYMQDEAIEACAGLLRLTETLNQKPQILDLSPVRPLDPGWKNIAFDKVCFSYEGQARDALDNFSLSIRRGEKIALVGKSGAGKSTMVKLLLKQMWPGSGKISVDGTDLRNISISDWLSDISYVPQDVDLFNMSIRENILLDRMDETDEKAYLAALEQSALHDFIDSLPDGDATLVGERGMRLSGGQRQRLGIARALVRGANIIVFDEATSSLDSLSEDAIRQAIEKSFFGKTLILIAHRLSTVRRADRVLVLDDGRLAEQGRFDELISQNGIFAKLWDLQSGHYLDNDVRKAQ